MEELILSRNKFLATLHALQRSLKRFSRKDLDDDIREGLVADLIKHNEMAFEAAIKFLGHYLVYNFAKSISGRDKTRNIIRECFALGILDIITTQELLDITDVRNNTVHEYDEEHIFQTCSRIDNYFLTLKKLSILPSTI